MKVVFVVLQYLAFQETIDCVMSITSNISYPNYEVVIVDNGSNDPDITKRLEELEANNVHLLTLKKNVGFARGNNVGIQYARETLKADIVVAVNNDTILTQSDFCEVLIQKQKQYGYSVLGPQIFAGTDRVKTNPLPEKKYSIIRTIALQAVLAVLYLLSFINADLPLDRRIGLTQSKETNSTKSEDDCDRIGVRLHGACVVFSPKYFEHYDGFSPRTFLFMEEDLLYIRTQKSNLLTLYTPDLSITHLEDTTINRMNGKGAKKRRFIYKNHIKSAYGLICEMVLRSSDSSIK